MTRITKTLVGTLAVGALALTSASPAFAETRHRDRGDKIDAGDIIAGALILGGIAVVASAAKNKHSGDYRYNSRNRGNSDRYDQNGYRGDESGAVDRCIRAAERNLSRSIYGRRTEVTDIRKVKRKRGGFEVKGRIAVEEGRRGYRYNDRRENGWDEGKFTCDVRHGRVVDIDYRGIRGV